MDDFFLIRPREGGFNFGDQKGSFHDSINLWGLYMGGPREVANVDAFVWGSKTDDLCFIVVEHEEVFLHPLKSGENNAFDRKGSLEIGWKFAGSVGSRPGFMIMCWTMS